MESKAAAIYLGKDGKVFGPFTSQQIGDLKRTGEFFSYSFIWDSSESSDWKPINMPPPPTDPTQIIAYTPLAPDGRDGEPLAGGGIEISALDEPVQIEKTGFLLNPAIMEITEADPEEPEAPFVPEPTPHRETPSRGASRPAGEATLQVICHDNNSVIGGVLTQPSSRGFRLKTNEVSHSLAPFGRGSKVWLNLLDESSGRTENLPATVSGVSSRDGKWEFEIVWESRPGLLG